MNRVPPTVARCAMMLLVLACAGCAGVKVSSVSTQDYIAQRRGDVLTTGEPSAAASDTLAVLGLDVKGCRTATPSCISALRNGGGLDSERRLATLSEIWLLHALALQGHGPMDAHGRDMLLDAYLQSSRYAYAYLFFSPRSPGERSFEERQTQVRDYYNYAVQQAVTGLFERDRTAQAQADDGTPLQVGDWRIVPVIDHHQRAPGGKRRGPGQPGGRHHAGDCRRRGPGLGPAGRNVAGAARAKRGHCPGQRRRGPHGQRHPGERRPGAAGLACGFGVERARPGSIRARHRHR